MPQHMVPWAATATPIAALLAGVVLLLFGRRLFWVFVAVIGFMAGWYLALGSWRQAPALPDPRSSRASVDPSAS